jgi:hypothetical protein
MSAARSLRRSVRTATPSSTSRTPLASPTPDAELYFGFDAVAPPGERFASQQAYDDAAIAVGQQVVDALRAEGLEVEWDGTPTNRPAVLHLDWRRPLPQS